MEVYKFYKARPRALDGTRHRALISKTTRVPPTLGTGEGMISLSLAYALKASCMASNMSLLLSPLALLPPLPTPLPCRVQAMHHMSRQEHVSFVNFQFQRMRAEGPHGPPLPLFARAPSRRPRAAT